MKLFLGSSLLYFTEEQDKVFVSINQQNSGKGDFIMGVMQIAIVFSKHKTLTASEKKMALQQWLARVGKLLSSKR